LTVITTENITASLNDLTGYLHFGFFVEG